MFLIFTKMLSVALMLGVGVLAYRLGIVSQRGAKEISTLIVYICSPVMVLSSALADETEFTLPYLGKVFLIDILLYLILAVLGLILPRLLGAPSRQYPHYSMLSLFANVGFVGIPVSLSILGPSAMLYVIAFNMTFNLFFYTYGMILMSGAAGKKIPIKLKSFLNAGVVACVLALFVYLFRLRLPAVLTDTMGYISSCTTFLALLILGINLATTALKTVLAQVRMYLFLLVRMLAFPIAATLALRALGFDSMLITATALMLSMPMANMPVMLATEYGADTDTLVSGVITSTLMCLVTIPIVSLFFPG